MPPPDPGRHQDTWTSSRPMVTGIPVVVGAAVLGAIVIILLASLGRQPDLVARISQQYTAMMAGTLVPAVRVTDPSRLAESLRANGLPFAVRVVALEPEFHLQGGRVTAVENRPTAAWMYRAADAEMLLVEAFQASLAQLGTPDERRSEQHPELLLFRKTTQTVVCWQDHSVVYALISTLPTEQVVRLARRAAAAGQKPSTN